MRKINERIKQLRKYLKMTQEDFGKKLGITKSGVSAIESGCRSVTDQHIIILKMNFHVNEEWLRTGEGEMFIPQNDDEKIAAFIGDLSSSAEDNFKKRLISILADLPVEGWEMIEQFTRELVQGKEN